MSDWQDISTAPKDATYVLVARMHEQGVAFFRDGAWHMGGQLRFVRPTHWMPLPAAPSTPDTLGDNQQ